MTEATVAPWDHSDIQIFQSDKQLYGERRPTLTARELEVVQAWLRVDSKEEAALQLYVSPATVATHISRVRGKYAECGRPARTKTALFARMVVDQFLTISDF